MENYSLFTECFFFHLEFFLLYYRKLIFKIKLNIRFFPTSNKDHYYYYMCMCVCWLFCDSAISVMYVCILSKIKELLFFKNDWTKCLQWKKRILFSIWNDFDFIAIIVINDMKNLRIKWNKLWSLIFFPLSLSFKIFKRFRSSVFTHSEQC